MPWAATIRRPPSASPKLQTTLTTRDSSLTVVKAVAASAVLWWDRVGGIDCPLNILVKQLNKMLWSQLKSMFVDTAGSGAVKVVIGDVPKTGWDKQLQMMPKIEDCWLDSTCSCFFYPQWRYNNIFLILFFLELLDFYYQKSQKGSTSNFKQ